VSRQWPEALRLYARLLVEYERVRRLGGGASAAKRCRPSPPVWRPLHDVASLRGMGRRVAPPPGRDAGVARGRTTRSVHRASFERF